MGRLTWESLPFKPLPSRRNVVLSSRKFTDTESYTSTDECIKNLHTDNIQTIFVIGGSFGGGNMFQANQAAAQFVKLFELKYYLQGD